MSNLGRIAALTSLLGLGCKPPPQGVMPICLAEVAAERAQESESQQLPPDVWFSIMLRGFDRASLRFPDPPRDCRGAKIRVETLVGPPSCADISDPGTPLPPRPLTPEDLLLTPTADGKMLVWVQATHHEGGNATGPVALAEWIDRGIAVRAIGSLTAQAHKAQLRLESMAEMEILVIESDQCSDPEKPTDCHTLVRLVPLVDATFRNVALLDAKGACLGPAVFLLDQSREDTLENGWTRRFEVVRSLRFEEGTAEINEQVTIRDSDPAEPDSPSKIYRQASVRRQLVLDDTGFVTAPGLWDKMIDEHGSVRPDE
ncbi:MAG: hypothetical protein V3V08_18425 [Nannocystaceae bacterium]